MKKRVLIIGGTYFLGRIFTMIHGRSADWEIVLYNRGRYDMSACGVVQLKGDRHDAAALVQVKGHYDAIIDCCAYEPGEIDLVLSHIQAGCGQYIFVSTCDVYPHDGQPHEEGDSFETGSQFGPFTNYIKGKIALEQELKTCCAARGIPCTSIRPAMIYGPFNYAPREGMFVKRAAEKKALHLPQEGGGSVQMVYVDDVAKALGACVGNRQAYDCALNICPEERVDYRKMFDILAAALPEQVQINPCDRAYADEHPDEFPLPLYAEESQYYRGEKAVSLLGLHYTPLETGLREAIRAFWQVFSGK